MTNDQHLLPLTSYLLPPLAASALIVAAIAILQRWWPIGVPYPWSLPGKFRATSVFGYPNAVGLYLAPLIPLLAGFAALGMQNAKCKMQNDCSRPTLTSYLFPLTFAISAVAALIAIAFARSTGALVALAVVLPVLLFSAWRTSQNERNHTHFGDRRNGWDARRGDRRAVGVVLVWILASLVLTVWLPHIRAQPKWGPPIVQKLTFQQWSGSVRLSQYRETWQLLRDHPIRGAGLAGYQTAIRPYHEKQDVEIFLYPHNLLLTIWVELGLAGLLVFIAILYQFFRQLFSPLPAGRGSERGWGQYGIAAALLVILIHGLVDVPYFKNDFAMLFWVIVAFGTIPAALGTIASYGRSVATGLHSSAPGDR